LKSMLILFSRSVEALPQGDRLTLA